MLISVLFFSIFLLTACEKTNENLDNENINFSSNTDINADQGAMGNKDDENMEDENDSDAMEQIDEVDVVVKEQPKQYESIAETVFWKNYSNDKFGYSLEYPGIASVLGNDLDERVEFVGPLEDNEWWPRISIAHYDSEFYHPDEGVAVGEWASPFPEYEVADNLIIAGQEAVHYVQKKNPQAWAADHYYFIKDGQLFLISIIHGNDRQDWPLYEKFLNSISFE